MPVDQTSLDRIRNATFPSSRRGYDKHEVEKFLARLADWLETGGGDESRSDAVKKELEKVGQRTGAILAQAEESAQQIRAEAEEEARGTVNTANLRGRGDPDRGRQLREGDTDLRRRLRATDAPGGGRGAVQRQGRGREAGSRGRRGRAGAGAPDSRGGHTAPRGHRGGDRRPGPPPRRRARGHRGAERQAERERSSDASPAMPGRGRVRRSPRSSIPGPRGRPRGRGDERTAVEETAVEETAVERGRGPSEAESEHEADLRR